MQSINLYLPEFRPKLNPLSARFLLILAGMYLLVMVLFQCQLWLEKKNLIQKSDKLNKELTVVEKQLDELKKVPKGLDKAQVEAALATAQESIRIREYALNKLNNGLLGNENGFSTALLALSRHALADIVLTEFAFLQGGMQVELAGVTKRNSAVPEYVHKLQSEIFFKNSDFGSLTLKKVAKSGLMEFIYALPTKEMPEKSSVLPSMQSLLRGG